MSITVERSTMLEIYNHAMSEYPLESCGWVIKYNDGREVYTAAQNLQDKYHKIDPESYPRTSKDAFLIDTLKMNRAIEEAEKEGGFLFSIVHSHIDCGAYFSAEDKAQMTTLDGHEPVFNSDSYLVVAVEKGKIKESAIFIFNKESKDFEKRNLVIAN